MPFRHDGVTRLEKSGGLEVVFAAGPTCFRPRCSEAKLVHLPSPPRRSGSPALHLPESRVGHPLPPTSLRWRPPPPPAAHLPPPRGARMWEAAGGGGLAHNEPQPS